MAYQFLFVDSLQKVLPEQKPEAMGVAKLSGLRGEVLCFQLAYTRDYQRGPIWQKDLAYTLSGDDKVLAATRISRVELVPVALPAYLDRLDGNYLFTDPRLGPDLLEPVESNIFRPYAKQWRSLWFEVTLGENLPAGDYPVTVQVSQEDQVIWEDTITLAVVPLQLPEQTLIHTEWFHGDCLADYYSCPVFSEEHWRLLGNFMESAVRNSVNLLLTPIFTPPLDTAVGGERTTIQLVGIEQDGDKFIFDFTLLDRWIELALAKGIRYFEMAHFFTQWGAMHAPKILARVDGSAEAEQIFGWDTPATGPAYKNFLYQFIPALKVFLDERGLLDRTYFHISDEPRLEHKDSYRAAKEMVWPLLQDCNVIDALSSYEFYRSGLVEHPIPSNNHIESFLDNDIADLWTYYCCSQTVDVSNRFMAMPSARNRIIGVQLYLHKISGFLHWGFNFYNAQYSVRPINPFLVTDAVNAFPSGDAFIVYPAKDGTALDSLRGRVFFQAMQDMRAFQLLESLAGREVVEALIHEDVEGELTFAKYPEAASYLLNLREKVNAELMRFVEA